MWCDADWVMGCCVPESPGPLFGPSPLLRTGLSFCMVLVKVKKLMMIIIGSSNQHWSPVPLKQQCMDF